MVEYHGSVKYHCNLAENMRIFELDNISIYYLQLSSGTLAPKVTYDYKFKAADYYEEADSHLQAQNLNVIGSVNLQSYKLKFTYIYKSIFFFFLTIETMTELEVITFLIYNLARLVQIRDAKIKARMKFTRVIGYTTGLYINNA